MLFIERHRSACCLLAVIALTGCDGLSSPSSSTPKTTSYTPKAPISPADVTVSMPQLHADLVAGVEQMQKKYAGKSVELSGGTIIGFGSKSTAPDLATYVDTVNIWERVGGSEFGVECEMKTSRPWKYLAPGQSIRVQGIGQPKDEAYQPELLTPQLTLQQAELVESLPLNRPVPSVTADDLVRQFRKNPQETKTKYNGRSLIIQGNIESVGKPLIEASQPFLMLKSPQADIAVKCSSGVPQSHPYWVEIQAKPIGAPITLFVESTEILVREKQISLFNVYEMPE
ncbi:OB-fold protein [Schlesneria paludicola]|uniref:OB-fold protein n=1 Tax=Schlesneria paludicola TaxID=360056 RepID=UPI00029A23A2|nr:hypothetical protein [Schlesneria paludicola]